MDNVGDVRCLNTASTELDKLINPVTYSKTGMNGKQSITVGLVFKPQCFLHMPNKRLEALQPKILHLKLAKHSMNVWQLELHRENVEVAGLPWQH